MRRAKLITIQCSYLEDLEKELDDLLEEMGDIQASVHSVQFTHLVDPDCTVTDKHTAYILYSPRPDEEIT